MIFLLATLAFGHGGEDHGAPPAPVATSDATTVSVAASSKQFEAVFRVKKGTPGTPVATTLLLDDFATSAPVENATPSIALQGPAALNLTFTPADPGVYAGNATFPAEGDYAGALVVSTPSASDLLSLTGLHIGAPIASESSSTGLKVIGVASALGALALGGLVTLAVGYAIGRRRGAGVAAALFAMGVATNEVSAHGGEDHGAPPSAAGDASGSLHLRMESQFLVGLRTVPLVHDTFVERVPALGRFVARAGGSATVRAQTSGEIAPPDGGFPAPGTQVHAGQLLATIRPAAGSAERIGLAESRQQAATAVAEAKKGVALAERDAAKSAELGEAISEREQLERQQSLDVARTTLAEAERALAAAGTGEGIAIRAPVRGKLGSVLARPGDQVQAGDELFRVVDASGLWLEARLPERFSAGVTATANAVILTPALDGKVLSATILDAGQEADPATGTLTVTLALDSENPDLHPGMSATAWIARGGARDALVVPDASVVDSNGIAIAFIKVGPEQFELREVKLGAKSGESWEVLAGLRVGERVVTEGTYTLRSLAGR